jgi:hypothetical protein
MPCHQIPLQQEPQLQGNYCIEDIVNVFMPPYRGCSYKVEPESVSGQFSMLLMKIMLLSATTQPFLNSNRAATECCSTGIALRWAMSAASALQQALYPQQHSLRWLR